MSAARLQAPSSFPVAADSLWFSEDGATLVARGPNDGILISVATGRVLWRGRGLPRDRHGFSRGCDRVALGGTQLTVLDVCTGAAPQVHDTSTMGAIEHVALSPDASLAAAVTASGMVALIELPRGRTRFTFGGTTSRDRWLCRTEHRGASFDGGGTKLLTYGTIIESTWGVATHHGLPDEVDDLEDFWTIYDVETGRPITTEATPRSRHEKLGSTSTFIRGSGLVLETRLGRFFSVLSPDRRAIAGGYCDRGLREIHASSDGSRVVTVDHDGHLALFGVEDEPLSELARRADAFNGFGLPTVSDEPEPTFCVFAEAGVLVVESWPERIVVARTAAHPRHIAVRPSSRGRCFATLDEGGVTLWEIHE